MEPPKDILSGLSFTPLITVDKSALNAYKARKVAEEIISFQCTYYVKSLHDLHAHTIGVKDDCIGVIGCGQVGKSIVRNLLKNGVEANSIIVSTRRPDDMNASIESDIKVFDDNILVSSKAKILIIACLASQLNQIASEIRYNIKKSTLIVSVVAGVGKAKLCQLFSTSYCVKTAVDTIMVTNLCSDSAYGDLNTTTKLSMSVDVACDLLVRDMEEYITYMKLTAVQISRKTSSSQALTSSLRFLLGIEEDMATTSVTDELMRIETETKKVAGENNEHYYKHEGDKEESMKQCELDRSRILDFKHSFDMKYLKSAFRNNFKKYIIT